MIPLRDVIPSRTTPGVTIALIVLNVVFYLLQLVLTDQERDAVLIGFGLVPAYFSLLNAFTAMFVHGGLAHLGGNMLFLWIFGDNVEDDLGHGRYAVFYLTTGLLASIAHVVATFVLGDNPFIPSLGASGAISGVMGGYLVLHPHRRVRVLVLRAITEVPAYVAVGLWFVFQLISAFGVIGQGPQATGGVAFMAHIGGFIAGVALVKVFAVGAGRPAARVR